MRVAMIGEGWSPDRAGGLNRYVRELHDALLGAGHDVALTVAGPAPTAPDHVRVGADAQAALPGRLLGLRAAVLRAAKGADVIDCHFALYGVLPLRSRRCRTPTVVHFHGPWAQESQATGAPALAVAIKRAVERATFARADRFIVLSSAFRAELVAYGVSDERIHQVRPGVDLARFHPLTSPDRLVGRERLGLALHRPVVVAVRRLVPRMGLDVLIDAVAGIPVTTRPMVVIVGDGPERTRLQERAAAKLRSEDVRFAGLVADDELNTYFAVADLAVLPSVSLEGFGLVLLEAAAAGTPVLASNVAGVREAVTGMPGEPLVPAGDVAAWSARLAQAVEIPVSEATRRAMRSHAEGFSWDATAHRVAKVYRLARSDRVGR